MKTKFAALLAGALLPGTAFAQTDRVEPTPIWQASKVEYGCSLAASDRQAANSFVYTKLRDGRFEIRVSGSELRASQQSDAQLLFHFGEETVAVGGTVDPIIRESAAQDSTREDVRLFDGSDYFEASMGEGPRERFSLSGIGDAQAGFLRCLTELPASEGPPRLIEFTGINELSAVANRQRMLGETLRYALQVADDGKATDCELSRKFRRRIVTISFCKVLLEHHRFAPARDAAGTPVPGSYEGSVRLDMAIKAG